MKRIGSAKGAWGARISLAVALLLAGVLLVLAFRGVDWGALAGRLVRGHLNLLALAFVTVSVSYFTRALRWRILLQAERPVPVLSVFWATAAGYLGNNFLPARAGELIRTVLLARKTGIGTSYVVATALVERVLDVVALALIGSVAVAALGVAPAWLVAATRLMSALAVLGLAAFFVMPRLQRQLESLLAHLIRSEGIRARVSGLVAQFLLGLRAFQHITRGVGFAALTAIIWLLDALALLLVASAFDLRLSLPQALLLLAALGLSSAAPSTPGYVGIYQFVAVTVLGPFGYTRDEALALILAAQAVIYLVVIVWGALGLWNLGIRQLRSGSAPVRAAMATERGVG